MNAVIPTRRACLFMRVSTQDQTCENQRTGLVQLARTRGFEIVDVFEEKVSSVAKNRREFDRMMLAAHAGKFDLLLVVALDRLQRSMVATIQTVLKLDAVGVRVISVREPWLDLEGPVRSLLIGVFGWIAEQERLQIVARTKAGLERARREGRQIGRPRARADLNEARALLAKGLSMPKVARRLNLGTSTLYRLLEAERQVLGGSAAAFPKGSGVQGVDQGAEVREITSSAAE
jgi:putative DNA-invertase from lambdoid prophage Rac